ncbi:MAG: LapA family protein [Syntrophaceae bacterium]|nr:LapA family protein [Syntrophaceae bacterium]
MQIFYWLALLVVIGMAIFAVQNSTAPPVVIKFLIWRFETSLLYTILGSIGLGILITLFFWVPRTIKTSMRSKELKREVKNLETVLYKPASLGQDRDKIKES